MTGIKLVIGCWQSLENQLKKYFSKDFKKTGASFDTVWAEVSLLVGQGFRRDSLVILLGKHSKDEQNFEYYYDNLFSYFSVIESILRTEKFIELKVVQDLSGT